jgi:hypothetical protein
LYIKPDSINFSIIKMDGFHGISSGKIIDRPDLCNYISDQMISWLSIINAMMFETEHSPIVMEFGAP